MLAEKWRVGRLLGRGGTSSVYATKHRNGKTCAIKVLHPDLAGSPNIRRRFLREGYIANRVGHEGVVSVLDEVVTTDGIVFLVMDLLDGVNVDRHCKSRGGSLPVGDVLAIADDVLGILAAAHEKGIVHRDIKPSNVFLTSKGTLKLLDFGIARLREIANPAAASATRSGFILGTPGFIAPEQARGRSQDIDARTDLWGLGATMFRLLTGRVVHEGGTTNESIIATATEAAAPIATFCPSLPPGVAALIDRALFTESGERWQSASEMLKVLRVERAKLPACSLPRPEPEADAPTHIDTREELEEDVLADEEESGRPSIEHRAPRSVGRLATYALVAAGALVLLFFLLKSGDKAGSHETAAALPAVTSNATPMAAPSAPAGWVAAPAIQAVSAPPSQEAAPPLSSAPVPAGKVSVRPSPAPTLGSARRGAAPAATSSAALPSRPAPTRLEDVLDERQ